MVKERTGTKNRPRGKRSGSSKKIANGLVALSSAAVLTVYTAGYLRTRSAAELFAADGEQRRMANPSAADATSSIAVPSQSVGSGNPENSGNPADAGKIVERVGPSASAGTSTPSGAITTAEGLASGG